MMIRSARVKTLALLLVLAIAAVFSAPMPCRAEEKGFQNKFKPGDVAPEIATIDLDNAKVALSSFKGKKVVFLNFWGIRCGSCIEEMPYVEALYQKYKDKDAAFLGVDTDGVPADIIRAALKDLNLKISYTLLLDLEFTITDTYTNFLVPLTIVIDKKGVITYIHTGFEKGREKEYEEALKKALG
jgi:peroxiredoxin